MSLSHRRLTRFSGYFTALCLVACAGDRKPPIEVIELGNISIDALPGTFERGTRDTLTATSHALDGQTVAVPVVWRSSNESVAVFERGGVLVAVDTGVTVLTATSLGVTSQGVQIRVVWVGAARIDTVAWTRPSALNPGSTLTDSIRVRVTNNTGAPVASARVAFSVAAGGGSVSPATVVITDNAGLAGAQWTLGSAIGTNTVTASVVRDDGSPNPLVAENLATFSIGAYRALTIQAGNNQTGQILADLATQPSVRLVDSLGAVRAGVPIVFSVHANGRVTTPVVSTNASGIATPGTWTLGDIPGEQLLEARVADATVSFRATGTGTPIHFKPSSVVAGANSTCALESDGAVKCWGESPQNGSGTVNHSPTPAPVSGALMAATLVGGPTHFCATKLNNEAWCWGVNALPDTTGAVVTTNAPAMVQSTITWSGMGPGAAHNCGLDSSQSLFCWGQNTAGQLGDLSFNSRLTIRPVQGGFTFSRLAAGSLHNCALSGGAAFCWGSNQFGQIGDGTTTNRPAPTAVLGGQAFQHVGSGERFSCALNAQGRAYCWGQVVGVANLSPITYAAAPNFASLAVGARHACALTVANEAYCWGDNAFGQVGDSTLTPRSSPTRVSGPLRFTQLSAGLEHTCGLTTNGAVACWGRNRGGELGDNAAPFRITPKHVVLGVNP